VPQSANASRSVALNKENYKMSLGSDFWELFSPLTMWQKLVFVIVGIPFSILYCVSFVYAMVLLGRALAQILMAILQ
jgi:hypothetical protein